MFDQLSDALFLYDKDLYIVSVNRAAQNLLGMAHEDMIGKHRRDLFRCAWCDPGCGRLQGLDESASVPTGTIGLHTASGRERLVVIRTVRLLDPSNHLEGVVATVKDITEEVEPARRQLIAESRAMREGAEFRAPHRHQRGHSHPDQGENDTGKDLVAKTLHYQSLRQAEPFLAINCAAIPETLLESEPFGYEFLGDQSFHPEGSYYAGYPERVTPPSAQRVRRYTSGSGPTSRPSGRIARVWSRRVP